MNDPTKPLTLLIGTHNSGKAGEVRTLLQGLTIDLRDLKEFPELIAPGETGASYVENAILKAKHYALETGMCALADDSGLEVDALGGRPGIYSARYVGPKASDSERVKQLLAELSQTGDTQRLARFRAAVAVVNTKGEVLNVGEGTCEGTISGEVRGGNGFGYDPIFIPLGYTLTFGELPQSEKDQISHRARALRVTKGFLQEHGLSLRQQ